MFQTFVKPQKTNFDLPVSLPLEYIGKKVRVVFYIDEDIKTKNEMEMAAELLYNDYANDRELTVFTALDYQNFYETN
jgi:hypothetical protein